MFIRQEIETAENIYTEPVSTGNSVRFMMSKPDNFTDERKDLGRMIAEIDPYRS
jgi:hypothetical protein